MDSSSHLSRRGLLAAAGAAALTWVPAFRIPARADTPPGFPLPLYRQAYQNWSEEITIDSALTCAPNTPAEVVSVANWAQQNGYRARPKGMGHNWSPILVPNGADVSKVILVDTTQHLTSVSIGSSTVTAQTGITMDALLAKLEAAGLGFAAIPAPGDITLGGVLAINAHGSAIPAQGETPLAGTSYGSLSNLIRSLTAVVWNGSAFTCEDVQPDRPCHEGVPGPPRPGVRHLGHPRGGRQPAAAVPELVRHPGTDVFAAPSSAGSSSFASLLTGAGEWRRSGSRSRPTPWIKVWTLSADQAALVEAGEQPVQLHVRELHQPAAVRLHQADRERRRLGHPVVREPRRWRSSARG